MVGEAAAVDAHCDRVRGAGRRAHDLDSGPFRQGSAGGRDLNPSRGAVSILHIALCWRKSTGRTE